MLITDAIEEYLAAKQNSVTHDTYKWYELFLDTFSAWCVSNNHHDFSELTATHVQQFVAGSNTTNTKHLHETCEGPGGERCTETIMSCTTQYCSVLHEYFQQ